MPVEGKSPVDIAIHAGMVCHPRPMAGTQERPQDIRTPEAERPQDEGVTLEVFVRHWSLALRDLCEQGANNAVVSLSTDFGPLTITYTPGRATVLSEAYGTKRFTDDELDAVGYLPADVGEPR